MRRSRRETAQTALEPLVLSETVWRGESAAGIAETFEVSDEEARVLAQRLLVRVLMRHPQPRVGP